MIDRVNKYGLCLDPTRKYGILDDIGEEFLGRAAQLVKSGHKFVYVLDNIDWEEKVHDMRMEVQNKSVHAVATSIVFDRVADADLPDLGPQQDLKQSDVSEVVCLSEEDMKSIRSRYGTLIGQLLFEHFPAFAMFKHCIPDTTDCRYVKEMSVKSEVVIMPVIVKDEKKYADCVGILDQLEKWTYQIYSAAGLCSSELDPITEAPMPTIACTSRPDQPASHARPTASKEDPLCGVKIPCFGDQLTRVRLAGAKDLRSGCHSAKDRLDNLYPFCIVDWHTKRSFLKVILQACKNTACFKI